MIEERGLQTDIEVDGGINAATIDAVLEAGANILVAGSAVFGKETAKNDRKIPETAGRLSGESQMKRAVIISGGKIQTDFALLFEDTDLGLRDRADKGVIFCHKIKSCPHTLSETLIRLVRRNTSIFRKIPTFRSKGSIRSKIIQTPMWLFVWHWNLGQKKLRSLAEPGHASTIPLPMYGSCFLLCKRCAGISSG